MPRSRDDESGKYTETYADADVISAIESAGGMASTTEVAEALGCAYETAYKKLSALEDAGSITSRKVGNARLWLLDADTDEGGGDE